ncbi:modification methylase [Candidatus Magnetoovum chiemensis]|nr:modification methylase [Candidatus Magnetoovum chiemensis]
MTTRHQFLFQDSRHCQEKIPAQSIALTVTSPPYPMIEMWDELFKQLNTSIAQSLADCDGNTSFELMHAELDKVWDELSRLTQIGGWVAINIGDATRKIGDYFQLYSNHSRITSKFIQLGFDVLPLIIWKKTTNAPNKFMGSGMLPAGAYVTLEHEYILIFRKGHRRTFNTAEEKNNRSSSAFFWEERNVWFSDTWDLKGINQNLSNGKTRQRSAAYTFELPFRLINMYSVKNDCIFDPFLGTGTTSIAAAVCQRNSIGVEIDTSLKDTIYSNMRCLQEYSIEIAKSRIRKHQAFIENYLSNNGAVKHKNAHHDFYVVTSQEKQLQLSYVESAELIDDTLIMKHSVYSDKTSATLFK